VCARAVADDFTTSRSCSSQTRAHDRHLGQADLLAESQLIAIGGRERVDVESYADRLEETL